MCINCNNSRCEGCFTVWSVCLKVNRLLLIRYPSVRREMCTSDSSYCRLLFSLPLFLSLSHTLEPCFLKYACPTFFSPTTLQNSNECPSLVPLFSSAFLCFICGWPNFQVGSILQFGDWRGRMSSIETDRHKRHTSQLAWMPLLCPLECPPTPITRIARLSSLAAKLSIFCYHGGYTVRYTLPAPPLCYLQFCERSKDSAIVSLILCNRAAENPQWLHITARWAEKEKKKRFIRVRKVDSLLFCPGSPDLQPVCLSGHTSWHNDLIHLRKVLLENRNDLFRGDWAL